MEAYPISEVKKKNKIRQIFKNIRSFINMVFDNSEIRRQDRLFTEKESLHLLANGEYGVLSMVCPNGDAYGVPVSYVWNGDSSIYIHCAPEGKKLRCIDIHPQVSFCITGRTEVIPMKFTTAYESIILQCHAKTGLSTDEREEALRLIIKKYSPQYEDIGKRYAEKSFSRTEIIKLEIETFSGKAKKI